MRAKLLCVDDDPTVLTALTRLLSADFEVLAASSAEQASEILKANTDVGIVLTDQNMSGSSGLEFLSQVQKETPDAIRILISGVVALEDMREAINSSQIHRMILKPWDNDHLRLQMIESLAAHEVLKEKRKLEKLSITDPVTGLKNHRYFQDQLLIEVERAIRHDRSVTLFMIDIDHFKHFNDHHGHPAGDALLKSVADRLLQEVRNVDTVARYGGEEFAVILPDTEINAGLLVAERIRISFEKNPFSPPDGRPTFVTVSLGVASAPQHAKTSADLIKVADAALYRAKRQGRNQSVGA